MLVNVSQRERFGINLYLSAPLIVGHSHQSVMVTVGVTQIQIIIDDSHKSVVVRVGVTHIQISIGETQISSVDTVTNQ